MTKLSIATPAHQIPETEYFLDRIQKSLDMQTFRDFEWVVTWGGRMAENSNAAIKASSGEIVKLLYMDDFFYSPNALQNIVDKFQGGWIASGCTHTYDGINFFNHHLPWYNKDILLGQNTIGSPSVIAFENKDPLFFDENMSFYLDCELYSRLHARYGNPTPINEIDIAIGLGKHQTTNVMTQEEKDDEHMYLLKSYKL